MKKNQFKSYRGMAAMCAMLTLASCGNDIELTDAQSPVKGAYKVTFTASQESSATRTAIDADDATKVIWQPGDAITVFDGNNQNCTFEFAKYTDEEDKTIGEFEGTITVTEPKRYCAVYPAAEGAEITEENDMISDAPTADAPASNYIITGLMLPTEQVATPGGFDPQAAIMTACNNNADNIKNESEDLTLGEFKHVCAFVKVTTTEAYEKITFTANGGDSIAGEFIASIGTDGISTVTPDASASSTVSLVPAAGSTKIAAGTYLIAILPGTLEKGFTMSCTSVDGENSEVTTMLRSFNGSTTVFSRRSVVNMGTVSATNWTNATHEYVDLGLSVKWASCNVGATTPTDYGDYFAWGETTGYSADEQHLFYWDNYSLTSDGGSTFIACTDANNNLLPAYDAATSNWGSAWRMPTKAEQDELRTQCTWTWYGAGNNEYSGVTGYKVTGTNGNSIFLPAAGCCNDTQYNAGIYGAYWSTSLFESIPGCAYVIDFVSTNVDWNDVGYCIGVTVRPVLAE